MNLPLSFKSASVCAALACASVIPATTASALQLEYDGSVAGLTSVNITDPGNDFSAQSFLAGGFNMKDVDTAENFTVFCLDLLAVISSNEQYGYTVTDTPFSNSVDLIANDGIDRIQKIFDAGYQTAFDSSVESAGFQVALWNAVYDTDWTVDGGTFFQTDVDSAVKAAANNFLGLAEEYKGDTLWKMTFLESTEIDPRSQNLVTVAAVPLPASLLMLMTAVGGGAFVGRRRRKSA